MSEENDIIGFKIQNKNPKKDPITYKISTIQDIADCVTNENIDGFLIDFEFALRSLHLMQAINKGLIDEGKIPKDTKIGMPSFDWIDDWKPKRKRNHKPNK